MPREHGGWLSRRRLLSIFGVAISLLFLWLALRSTNLPAVADALGDADLRWAGPFLVALFLFYWLKSLRWRDLLRPKNLTGSTLFPIVMIGYAATAVLPMQMGELVRSWLCARRCSIPLATVLGSVAIERVFDLLIVLLLLGNIIIAGGLVPPIFMSAGYAVAGLCLIIVFAGAAFLICRESAMRWSAFLLGWLPDNARRLTLEQLARLADSLAPLSDARNALRVAASSLLQWLLMGACVACSLYALGITIPPSGILLVLVAIVLGVSLPTSPGYVGNIQLAYSLSLAPYGVDPSAAFAASVFYHILAYGAVTTVGFTFLYRMGYVLGELRQVAKDRPESGTHSGL